ncbi:MAG: DUF1598 domain-containing protein [Thermoguttaceae bacterium]|nr:DUF1598 domain-containing protein [Thermoguttaceae bacterium]
MLRKVFVVLAVLAVCMLGSSVFAQTLTTSNQSSVGGVLIDASGMLSQASVEEMNQLRLEIKNDLDPIAKGLNKAVQMRRVSLKKLNEEIAKAEAEGSEVPDSVRFLGGLTSIQSVVLFPEEQDVVLVGPAEGWVVGPQGVLVGKETGKPIMRLDDLVAAIQAASAQNRSVFSVSIDPTKEGLQRMSEYASSVNPQTPPKTIAQGMEKALGDQTVTLNGIDEASHFAYVMAAADFRMKQISMGATKSPVKTLPSFVSMMKNPSPNGALPRWWLAPNFADISRDAQGLTWSLDGGKVVTMTDTDFFDGNQIVRKGAKASDVFQQWADKMTENYDALSVAEPIFGQLRNCMDCALVGAIFAEGKVLATMGNSFAPMMTSKDVNPAREVVPAKAPSSSVVARRSAGIMFVTGGVSINPWEMVQSSKTTDLKSVREKGAIPSKRWYEN